MNNLSIKNIGLFLLAIVFSVGLMFAFIELPRLLDQFIQSYIPTPHSDPAYDHMRIEIFYSATAIRLIGYLCLILIIGIIILGFTTRKTSLAWIGGIAIFLPVFATFAHSMFYLAGLGLLNIIIFPLQDISLSFVNLGNVVLVPYWILRCLAGLFNWNAHHFLVYFFMIGGALLFTLGVFAWLQMRYKKLSIATHWIYKYSRHPQYLGWMIWSYGLMLYGPSLNNMKKSWGWYGTLPFLLSGLIIIGICLLEEIKMKEISGKDYETYRNRTPFLFPIPKFLRWIIKAPIVLFIGKARPEKRKEVGGIITLYSIIFVGLSLFWVDLSSKDSSKINSKAYHQEKVDLLITEIRKPQAWRYRNTKPFGALFSMGEQTYPYLMDLIKDPNPDIRQISIQASDEFNILAAIPSIITAITDSVSGIAQTAIRALGNLKAKEATDTILFLLEHPMQGIREDVILTTLSKLGCESIFPYLEKQLESDRWYQYAEALRGMMRLNPERAKPYIYMALEDESPLVRREVVNLLLESLPADAIPHLKKVIHDENWDVRFYAKQAIKMIERKQK